MASPMRTIKTLALHLLGVAAFLLALEGVSARLLVEPSLQTARTLPGPERTLAAWPLRADPLTGWALAYPGKYPNLARGFLISHVGVGLRWVPASPDKGLPLVLLVVGDEMAFGPTVPLHETMGGWIKRVFEAHVADRTVAVATAAVPGYDALQMSLQLSRLTSIRPHLILCCLGPGECFRPQPPRWYPRTPAEAKLRSLLYRPALTQVLFLGLHRLVGGEEVRGVGWQVSPDRFREPDTLAFARSVRAIIRQASRHKIPLLMVNLGLAEPLRQVLHMECTSQGVVHVDGDLVLLEHAASGGAKEPPGGGDAGWAKEWLRPEVVGVFTNPTYFTPSFLPTRTTYRVLGDALAGTVLEEDLFSWRRRVLR